MTEVPAISIIMPSLNVGAYIRECMESVVSQTLQNIEIICVDAGSTDGTLEVVGEYARKDQRITLIHSSKRSYGYQMNLGLDAARGEYIGIVETDDWVEPHMFETLWKAAVEHGADMVKSDYYWFWTTPEKRDEPYLNLAKCPYETVFMPSETRELMASTPAIWAGIYKKEMLLKNGIRFHETPGAAFQDASFHFMLCTAAQSCYLLKDRLLHYRQDNEASSTNSFKKIFCILDETRYFEAFLDARPAQKARIEKIYQAVKFEHYRWNYEKMVPPQHQWKFLQTVYDQFAPAQERGLLDEALFFPRDWDKLERILTNPIRFFADTCKIYATRPKLSEVFPPQVLIRSKVQAPEVSVVIPCYNAHEYLSETLDSVLTQEGGFELVCVNDGSTDDTLKILRSYAQRNTRITVVTQVNKGLSASRNAGIREAQGEFVLFLDSDDLLAPGAVTSLYERAQRDSLDTLYYDGRSFYESEELRRAHPYYETAYEYPVQLPDVLTGKELFCQMRRDGKYRTSACLSLYRKAYLEREGLSFEDGILHEDNLFSFVNMLSCERVGHTREQFLLRRVHAGSTMTSVRSFMNVYGFLICAKKMMDAAAALPYDQELCQMMTREINDVIINLQESYHALADKAACREKMTALELLLLDRFLSQPVIRYVPTGADEAALIRASATYKIGRAVTFLPRKLRGGVRCLQENGLRYTLNRLRAKFFHLFGEGKI